MADKSLTLINRQNAQHSTGPRTEAGKRASSLNSLRHGLTGNFVLLSSEDPEAYRLFLRNLQADLQPEGALETQLVQTIADTYWRLNRIQSIEAGLFEQNEDSDNLLDRQLLQLQLLSLYEQRLNRILQSNLKQLRLIKGERRAQLKTEFLDAGKIRNLLTAKSLPFHPADFGFVCSPTEIDRAVRRQEAIFGILSPARGTYSAPN